MPAILQVTMYSTIISIIWLSFFAYLERSGERRRSGDRRRSGERRRSLWYVSVSVLCCDQRLALSIFVVHIRLNPQTIQRGIIKTTQLLTHSLTRTELNISIGTVIVLLLTYLDSGHHGADGHCVWFGSIQPK